MRSLVVEASVAIKWFNPREVLADKASALYADYEQGQFSLLVPTFWDYEVANGINKAVARRELTEQEGHEAIALRSPTPWTTSVCGYRVPLLCEGSQESESFMPT